MRVSRTSWRKPPKARRACSVLPLALAALFLHRAQTLLNPLQLAAHCIQLGLQHAGLRWRREGWPSRWGGFSG